MSGYELDIIFKQKSMDKKGIIFYWLFRIFFKDLKTKFFILQNYPGIKNLKTIRSCLLFPKSRPSINEMIDKHKYEKEAVTEAFHWILEKWELLRKTMDEN